MSATFAISCPLPLSHHKTVVMGHGSGGRLSAQLIHDLFLPAFDNPVLRKMDDQAVLDVGSARLAFTTDSFVVTPLFFPGRKHRRTGREWDRQRPGDERCKAALAVRGFHHGRRPGY